MELKKIKRFFNTYIPENSTYELESLYESRYKMMSYEGPSARNHIKSLETLTDTDHK